MLLLEFRWRHWSREQISRSHVNNIFLLNKKNKPHLGSLFGSINEWCSMVEMFYFISRFHHLQSQSPSDWTGMCQVLASQFHLLTQRKLLMAPLWWTLWTRLQMKIPKVLSTGGLPPTLPAWDIPLPLSTAWSRYGLDAITPKNGRKILLNNIKKVLFYKFLKNQRGPDSGWSQYNYLRKFRSEIKLL